MNINMNKEQDGSQKENGKKKTIKEWMHVTQKATDNMEADELQAYNDSRMKQIQEKFHLEKLKKRKREIIIISIIIVILLILFLVHLLGQYQSYSVKGSIKTQDASGSNYVDFHDNLLKYSNDGAFYTDYNGELIWNYTYEMTNPTLDTCGGYALIYDKKGTQLSVLTTTGIKGDIKTNLPIVEANVADQGTVAVLMQEGNTSYLQIYNVDGDTLASGELHTENSGYPVAIALSSDAKKLMVSMINLNDGAMKSTIAFYNFGSTGKKEIDNIVASYSYSNMIIPEIDFVGNDKAIAFGDTEIIIFNNSQKPKVDKEIYPETDMKSVFYNDSYFGTVCAVTQEDGTTANEMTVYSMNGFKRFSKNIKIPYSKIELMDNNEIMLTNGTETNIYTLFGIKKFAYTFETGIYKIIPGDSSRRYMFIEDGVTEKVRIN